MMDETEHLEGYYFEKLPTKHFSKLERNALEYVLIQYLGPKPASLTFGTQLCVSLVSHYNPSLLGRELSGLEYLDRTEL